MYWNSCWINKYSVRCWWYSSFLLLLLTALPAAAQTELVGKVTDSDSSRTPFFQAVITVSQNDKVKETLKTYFDGTFRIKVRPSQTYQLKVSYPGYVDSVLTLITDKKTNVKQGSLVFALHKDGLRLMGYVLSREGDDPIEGAGLLLKNVMTRKETRFLTDKAGYYNMQLEYETNYSLKIDKRSPGIINKYQDTSFYLSTIGFNQPLDFRYDIKLGKATTQITARDGYDPTAQPQNKNLKPVLEVYGYKDSVKKQQQQLAIEALSHQLRQKDSLIAGLDQQLADLKNNQKAGSSKQDVKAQMEAAAEAERRKLAAAENQQRLRQSIEEERKTNQERVKREAEEKQLAEERLKAQVQRDYEAAMLALKMKKKKLDEAVTAAKEENRRRDSITAVTRAREAQEAAEKKAALLKLEKERIDREKRKTEEDRLAAMELRKKEAALQQRLAAEEKARKEQAAVEKAAREKAAAAAAAAQARKEEQERKEKAETARIAKEKEAAEKRIAEQHFNDSMARNAQLKLLEKQRALNEKLAEASRLADLSRQRKVMEDMREAQLQQKALLQQQLATARQTPEMETALNNVTRVETPREEKSATEMVRENMIAYYERKLRETREGGGDLTQAATVAVAAPPKLIKVSGLVVNAESGSPVADVAVNVRKLNTVVSLEVTTDETGHYSFEMDSGYFYLSSFFKEGYKNGKQLLDLTEETKDDYVSTPFQLVENDAFDINEKLPAIYFEKNGTNISAASKLELLGLVNMMKEVPNLRLKLYGLAGNEEDAPLPLSVGRVREVAKFFRRNGITDEHIYTIGFGAMHSRSGCIVGKPCPEEQKREDRVVLYKLIK